MSDQRQVALLDWLREQDLPWSPTSIHEVRHLGFKDGTELDLALRRLVAEGSIRKVGPNTWDSNTEREPG